MEGVTAPGPGNGADEQISFPAAARLELDELLEQLVDRARDVQQTQSRLRGLLNAYREVTRDGRPGKRLTADHGGRT
ncbi:hypothetical protein [Catelliglobosispora koreensis]|uniref:hypothetical protein n=1 Tax=Catelliglobosispora koreensis TaxID=129052 RepID=UPI000476B1E8|nr:hypothetical protein [Catelliglobosispora koreensis]